MGGARVVIGRIGRPHGVRGAVRVTPTGPTLASLGPGDEVLAEGGPVPDEPRRLVLAARAGTDERPILSFEGVEDRGGAAGLTGASLALPAERIPAIESPDTFYVRDLIGCAVLVGDRHAGHVTDVHPAPANDVVEVDGALLVPFTADAILEVDTVARRLVVRADLFGD